LKRTITAVLVLLLLICFTSALAGTAGTAADPLVSLSYIDDTFVPAVLSESKNTVNAAVDEAYEAASEKAAALYGDCLLRLGGPDGYSLLKGFAEAHIISGSSLHLVTGASFIPVSGTVNVTLESGTLVDVSTGSETASGATLTAGHRYLCCENTKAAFTAAADAVCMVDGYIKGGTGVDVFDTPKAVTPAPGYVILTKQTIVYNGKPVTMEVYNISDNNYFKLRDIAQMMNGTSSQFSVDFSLELFTVYAEIGKAYTSVGGEMTTGTDKSSTCIASSWGLKVDGVYKSAYIYNLGGNNFFKLRDLGGALGFTVDYDAQTNTVLIYSSDYKA